MLLKVRACVPVNEDWIPRDFSLITTVVWQSEIALGRGLRDRQMERYPGPSECKTDWQSVLR